jgi:hypothetical protein
MAPAPWRWPDAQAGRGGARPRARRSRMRVTSIRRGLLREEPSGALVRASVRGADGSRLAAAAASVGFLLLKFHCRRRIELDCGPESANAAMAECFLSFDGSTGQGDRSRQAPPLEQRSSHTYRCSLARGLIKMDTLLYIATSCDILCE